MLHAALGWLSVLRTTADPSAAERFVEGTDGRVRELARGSPDPDEVAQRARLRIWRAAPHCRARTPGELARWLRRIVHRCAADVAEPNEHRDPVDAIPAPDPDPEAATLHRERGERLEQAIAEALRIEPSELPHRHRAWARRHRVAATRAGIARDVHLALAVHRHGERVAEVARRHGLTVAAARQAVTRGLAACRLAVRLLSERSADRIPGGIRNPTSPGGAGPRGPRMLSASTGAPSEAGSSAAPRRPSEDLMADALMANRGVPAHRLGPWELLAGVAAGDRDCANAFAGWLVDHPAGRRLPPEHRLDVLHDVIARFLSRARAIVETIRHRGPRRLDDRLHAYVGRAVLNRYRTLRRKRSREVRLDGAELVAPDPLPTDAAYDRGWRVLEAVEARVVVASPRPAAARRTLDELRGLALGTRTMAEVVAGELGRDPGPDFDRARSRLYVRHRRMRAALLETVAAMRADGALPEADASLARWLVEGMLTRRVTRGPSSSPAARRSAPAPRVPRNLPGPRSIAGRRPI